MVNDYEYAFYETSEENQSNNTLHYISFICGFNTVSVVDCPYSNFPDDPGIQSGHIKHTETV